MRWFHSNAATSAIGYVAATFFGCALSKVVITRFFFDYPIVILMLQMATSLFAIELLRMIGVLKLSPYSFDKGRQCFIPSILLSIGQWLTISSYEGISMPSFDAVKRLTPALIVLAAGMMNRHIRMEKNQMMSIGAVVFCSFLAVNLELTVDRYSLFYGLIACGLQAIAYLQFENLSQSFQAIELMYMHSFNSLIVFLVADIVQDEIRDAFMYVMTSAHPLFTSIFICLLFSTIFLQYATFACIQHNGALQTQLLSNIRATIQIFFCYFTSLYLFYDLSPSIINYLGLFGTFGAVYCYYITNSNEPVPTKPMWQEKA